MRTSVIHFAALLFVTQSACNKSDASCPQSSHMIDGVCRASCTSDFQCLQTERCDTTLGVCVTNANPLFDAGDVDMDSGMTAMDATSGGGKDAFVEDARTRRDSGMETKDAEEQPDLGFMFDAGVDAGTPDAGPPCKEQDGPTCIASPVCLAHACVDCSGHRRFHACTDPNDPPPPCPQIDCNSCANNPSDDACRTTGQCHPLFVDHPGCGCPEPGCCMQFSNCADGVTTSCMAPITILCDMPMPVCEMPYVNSYTTICYEGCVTQDECQP